MGFVINSCHRLFGGRSLKCAGVVLQWKGVPIGRVIFFEDVLVDCRAVLLLSSCLSLIHVVANSSTLTSMTSKRRAKFTRNGDDS